MLTRVEKTMYVAPFTEIRAAYISRAKLEAGRVATAHQMMTDNGFERVEVTGDALLTDDGREVLRAHGKAWALLPEIHAKRVADALEQAKQRAVAAQQEAETGLQTGDPATCNALIDGQLCGGTLVRAAVCPRCALGKSGVAATLTCDVCGHVTAVMRGDS